MFYFITFCIVFGLFIERWLFNTWADLSADEIVFHLKASLGGTDPGMIKKAVLFYGLPAILVMVIVFLITRRLARDKKLCSYMIMAVLCLDLLSLFFIKYDMDKRIDFTHYMISQLSGENSTFIEDNYVDPAKVDIQFPEKKRNLIFIYLESMEMTFADTENGGAFKQNIIPELTELAKENEDFSGDKDTLNGGVSLPGTTWTIGAMFGQSSGLPLKIPLEGNEMKGQDSFFPSLKTMGDILKDGGYQQELLIGSKAGFGGRDIFYSSHGDFQLNDYLYALKHGRIPENYKVFWGYEDEKLFRFAKEDLLRMARDDKPFNLTMLTVDTHFEDGYPCRLCRNDFGEQYADCMACSSRQVAEFVSWIQKQDFYEDTAIVISGDHPTMDKDFCKDVSPDYQRKTYVCYINSSADPEKGSRSREYATFDLFPTTMAALGIKFEGDKLGLGTNLFSGKKTLLEKYGVKKCSHELELPSDFMRKLSGIDVTEKTLKQMSEETLITAHKNENGMMELTLDQVYRFINPEIIKDIQLELTDKETGKVAFYHPELTFPNESDPNKFCHVVNVDLKGKRPEDYKGEYFITIEGINHYKIADFEHNLEN